MSRNVRPTDNSLSTKQVQALPHLAAGNTLAHTATAVNVSDKTLSRWMNEPEFKASYLALRELEAEIATAELRGLGLKAAMVLSRAMDNPDPYISLRAAQTSVNISTKLDVSEDAKLIARYLSQLAKEDNETNGPRATR